ncbi:unnamed protein product [Rhizoctonia solani]|uniref:AAA+ ATPase domain-containing protein n=2 Tax=Rhizoctonia solani TaxID=456999 RepID=A0A8H2XP22_9AGAM|nr:putative P-loop nucleoside triphosphate hydrolase [Rhizoctonia solani 123E]CAE6427141.1 unnamed protein product [Rhizoctonia solani]
MRRARYQYTPPPGMAPNANDLEDISPKAYFASFDQVWDRYVFGNWVTIRLKSSQEKRTYNPRLIFKAYKRVHGPLGPSIDDHTWIELISDELVKFLRSQHTLKGVDGLNQSPPGVDARDLFLRLDTLKASAVKPTLEPEEDEPAKEGHNLDGLGLSLSPPVVPAAPEPEPPTLPDSGEVPFPPDSPASTPPSLPLPIDTRPPLTVPEQLWILLDFIESHFQETVEELERLKSDGYMSYKLLWAICTPGNVVESKDQATEYPMGMRVESWGYGNDGTKFVMQGATYSWDGKVFKQEIVPVEIVFFKGLMKADQIPIKILTDQAKRDLIERGKIYQKYAGIHYLKYDAFTAISTERGIIKLPAKGRVMIDADGYSRYNLNTPGGYQPTTWNTYPSRIPPPVPYYSPQQQPRIPHEEYKNDSPLPDEIICLTPPTHKGWSFVAKAWGSVLVTNLSEITFDELAFDQLVLKSEYKKMIKALVETHSGSGDGLAKDLVSGKGGGMVMVLHGKPGTGKTLTAEAVSEHLKCPLYVISSGELGTEASHLEKQLHDVLEMTAAWKAVVLIDEADVFLEARNTFDLMRNGLVSVFLRVLEYHTGVLILTTNRIRTFDKAFVSRFSIAIHYPDLDQASRQLIWKEFLVRAGVDVGDMGVPPSTKPSCITHDELVLLAKKSFNGRVIKQIVRGAQALSIADKEPLSMSHILAVLGITEQFEADWKELEFTENIPGKDGRQDASMYS